VHLWEMSVHAATGGFGLLPGCTRPAMAALEMGAAGLKAEDARAIGSMLLLESVRDRMASVRVVSGERA
jgi:2-keto-3-deoxy-6-phosphogluconate aldolase